MRSGVEYLHEVSGSAKLSTIARKDARDEAQRAGGQPPIHVMNERRIRTVELAQRVTHTQTRFVEGFEGKPSVRVAWGYSDGVGHSLVGWHQSMGVYEPDRFVLR